MGGGTWTSCSFRDYASTKGFTTNSLGDISDDISVQDSFKKIGLQPSLNPFKVTRECVDSEEHPDTTPVILALDVTGSMGQAAVEVAKKLNSIMTDLYSKIKDVEFCIMGIGDTYCDQAPIQMSQFESDIRIAEAVDQIYFEGGGGGNAYESYTAAWYMGTYHTKLDCWKRDKKGIIITMGDEQLNPYFETRHFIDDQSQSVDTKELFEEAEKKFSIYHISIDDEASSYRWTNSDGKVDKSWKILGDNYKKCSLKDLAGVISKIIIDDSQSDDCCISSEVGTMAEISW